MIVVSSLCGEDNTHYECILLLWCSIRQDESALKYLLYNILLHFQSVKMTADLKICYQNRLQAVFLENMHNKIVLKKNLNVSYQGYAHVATNSDDS